MIRDCSNCSGTGIGRYEHVNCGACNGTGQVRSVAARECTWEVGNCTVCEAPVYSYKHEVSFPEDGMSDNALLCDCCADDATITVAYLYELVTAAARAYDAAKPSAPVAAETARAA